jgi:hypothetical protein
MANKKFKTPSGIYRSSWIVREYKKRHGKYKSTKKSTNKSGLKRWFAEQWINLSRPIYSKQRKGSIIGYHKCGRKKATYQKGDKYPVCRPSKRITKNTPITYKELSSKTIKKAIKMKKKITYKHKFNFSAKS